MEMYDWSTWMDREKTDRKAPARLERKTTTRYNGKRLNYHLHAGSALVFSRQILEGGFGSFRGNISSDATRRHHLKYKFTVDPRK